MSRTRPETCDECALWVGGDCTRLGQLRRAAVDARVKGLTAKARLMSARVLRLEDWRRDPADPCREGEFRSDGPEQLTLDRPVRKPPPDRQRRVDGPAVVVRYSTPASCGSWVEQVVVPDSEAARDMEHWREHLGDRARRIELWWRAAGADLPEHCIAVYEPRDQATVHAPPPHEVRVCDRTGRIFAARLRPGRDGGRHVYQEPRGITRRPRPRVRREVSDG